MTGGLVTLNFIRWKKITLKSITFHEQSVHIFKWSDGLKHIYMYKYFFYIDRKVHVKNSVAETFQGFFVEYYLCNNYLLKSKISNESIKQFGFYKCLIFNVKWSNNPSIRFKIFNDCRCQTVLWIDLKFWI